MTASSTCIDTYNTPGVLHCCQAIERDCGGSPETYSEKLRLQLASLAQRFAGFKSSIAEDTRRRRLLEEERYKQLHHALQAIEDGIAVEMRKRGEARKMLESLAKKIATEMLERLQAKIGKHIAHLTGALDHLITRCEELEQGVNCLKGEHASKLLRQSAELMARCRATRAAFEAEVLSRNEREDAAGNKLEELLKSLDSKVESEIAARHQQVAAVRRDVGLLLRFVLFDACVRWLLYHHSKASADLHGLKYDTLHELTLGMVLLCTPFPNYRGDQPREQFHTFVKEELGELREGLTAAMRAREEADDEILQAINEYTTALQRGLQNVSGLHTISSVL
ncbi:hypothetical protein cyc_04169 [Cyclospora cayetanensis]|uniref:SF-assemblin n=1 Tax=Cyclospora cayetanensis TaxID=88456 RepID=A0A1D3D5A6_9EIME|nr:hypothetical protein cyc_04169 [Cyclospora cayetanensis]